MDSRRKILAGQSDCYVLCLTDLFHLEFGIWASSRMLSQTAARSLPSFCPEMTRKGTLPFRRSPVFPRYGRIKAPDRGGSRIILSAHIVPLGVVMMKYTSCLTAEGLNFCLLSSTVSGDFGCTMVHQEQYRALLSPTYAWWVRRNARVSLCLLSFELGQLEKAIRDPS